MEPLVAEIPAAEEINWNDLCKDLNRKRCVLFLGPSLPLYTFGNDKIDFYSLAALHLSEQLIQNHFEFDHSQSQNLYYIAQKFVAFKKNYRTRLEDELADLYKTEEQKLLKEKSEALPHLYKTLLLMPWHTIVNMQPDSFFEAGLKPTDVFAYYHYKNKDRDLKLDKDQFLVYNLFGTMVKENGDYNVDSLVVTEEDQVEFVRNLVSGNPKVPECVISRLDNDKTYIFLDCNLENWYFRLLMEILKIHKDSHTFSPRHKSLNFSPPTLEFYKNRYGFVFINNNSEEFVDRLWQEYKTRYAPPAPPSAKKIFLAYSDSAEAVANALALQFTPWIEKKVISLWRKDSVQAGEVFLQSEQQAWDDADSIILFIDAPFLNEPNYTQYVKPALEKATQAEKPKKVFAIIKAACPWEETPVQQLPAKHILPANRTPLSLQADADSALKEIVISITKLLWE